VLKYFTQRRKARKGLKHSYVIFFASLAFRLSEFASGTTLREN